MLGNIVFNHEDFFQSDGKNSPYYSLLILKLTPEADGVVQGQTSKDIRNAFLQWWSYNGYPEMIKIHHRKPITSKLWSDMRNRKGIEVITRGNIINQLELMKAIMSHREGFKKSTGLTAKI